MTNKSGSGGHVGYNFGHQTGTRALLPHVFWTAFDRINPVYTAQYSYSIITVNIKQIAQKYFDATSHPRYRQFYLYITAIDKLLQRKKHNFREHFTVNSNEFHLYKYIITYTYNIILCIYYNEIISSKKN